jgi:large subunit ribosomal protein L4
MKVSVLNFSDAKATGEVALSVNVFGLEAREDIIHRVVKWQLAKRRLGTRKAKTISEVSGTTKKPHSQKGTGRARLGSLRVVQCRGGGIAHGPVVRSHEHSLNKKFRKLGLRHALSAKQAANELLIVDNFDINAPKTSVLASTVALYNARNILVIYDGDLPANISFAACNIHTLDVLSEVGLNVYDIIRHEKVIITASALKKIEERLS